MEGPPGPAAGLGAMRWSHDVAGSDEGQCHAGSARRTDDGWMGEEVDGRR